MAVRTGAGLATSAAPQRPAGLPIYILRTRCGDAPDRVSVDAEGEDSALVLRLLTLGVAAVTVLTPVTMPSAAPAAAGSLPTAVTAQTSAESVALGTRVTVSGTVTPQDLVAPREVVLQFRTGTGWREMARMATDATGGYMFPVPTDWYGDHVLRVVAPLTVAFAEGVSELRTVSVTPQYPPRGSSSAWKLFPNSARWDPCTVVEYRTNLGRAPKGTLRLIDRAFRIVHAATGLTFRHAGATRKVPFSGGSEQKQFHTRGLVVAWTTPKVVRALTGSSAGVGGAISQSVDGGAWRYVRGGVSIDATQRFPVRGLRKGQSTGALLLHEIAHAMGLTHVQAKSQLMYPSLRRTHRARYEAGDLAGLRAVGAAQGCF